MNHYATDVGIQAIHVAKYVGFLQGSILKYIWRYGKKENASVESDLAKAFHYCEILQELLPDEQLRWSCTPEQEAETIHLLDKVIAISEDHRADLLRSWKLLFTSHFSDWALKLMLRDIHLCLAYYSQDKTA